jgi:hypothetical protein
LTLATFSGLGACAPESNPLESRIIGAPDRPKTAEIEVDEARITTRYDGTTAIVTVPVKTLAGAGAAGEVRASITPLASEVGSIGATTFTTASEEALVDVRVPHALVPANQPEQARMLVRWAAKAGKEQAYGARSLFQTTRHFGVQLWAPTHVDAGATTAVRVWVRDLTGKLLPDVEVSLQAASTKTDLAGQAEFSVSMPEDQTSFPLVVSATLDGLTEVVAHSIAIEPAGAPRLFLSTDKPLYRPGQTIHIRALALRKGDRKPIATEPITFEVRDGKGTKIFKEETATDAYGVASLTAPLATQINVGDYLVRVVTADHEVERTVKVSEEKLPKFGVATSLDEPWFAPGQALNGSISARYFYGKPVIDAAVKVSIQGWTGSVFTGKTNDEGILAFELPGPDLEGVHGATVVPLMIEVVDSAGFSVLATAAARVAEPELTVKLLPEASRVPFGATWQAYLLTRGPLGEPVDASCQAVGDGGVFTGSEPVVSTGAGGIAVLEQSGSSLNVKCTTAEGLSGSAKAEVETGPLEASLLLRPAKALFAAGEAIKLELFAASGVASLYVDRIHRGRIVESLEIPMAEGKGILVTRPAAGEEGTLTFTAYYAQADGRIVTGERFVYVQPPLAKVSVATSQESFLPGSEATLSFQVTDPMGDGQAAAIGVTIADEAVFALAGGVGPDDVAGYFLLADEPQAVRPFALTQDRSAVDVAAAAALAELPTGMSTASPGQTEDSLKSAVNQVTYAELEKVSQILIQDIQAGVKNKSITRDNAVLEITGVALYDYWGKPMELSANVSGYDYGCYTDLYVYVTVLSCGPDEAKETWDDYTRGFSVPVLVEDCYADGARGAAWDAAAGQWPAPMTAVSEDQDGDPDPPAENKTSTPEVKKRDEFPETLYVNPALITDGQGKAEVKLGLADAITEWRVSMIANTAGGLVGGNTGGITVFQPFFVDTDLPRKLTQNDQLDLPVAIFNYGDQDEEVEVTVAKASWFELSGPSQSTVLVPKGKSLAVPVRIKVVKPGTHTLEVTAVTDDFGDGVVRTVDVAPDGQKVVESQSGALAGPMTLTASYPNNSLEGGSDLLLKLMGGPSAQMVDGMDALLSVPQGCFEPMMNSTWIDALVIDYLGWTGSDNQALLASARALLDSGVQQCATFECDGGGFTWFGNPDPAHPILTAFGLMMFEDIANLRDVDEGQVQRAAQKLTSLQNQDGGWITHEGTKNELVPWDELRTTCVVAWGLASTKLAPVATLASAVAHIHQTLDLKADTYTLAMCANALLKASPSDPDTDAVVAEILDRVQESGEQAWWDSGSPGVSLVEGEVATVETTALVAQALYKLETLPLVVEGALKFLASKKSPDGNFRSTQGTIQSLRAFVEAAKYGSSGVDATVEVKLAGTTVHSVHIDAGNREVVHLIDLKPYAKVGGVPVSLGFAGTGTMYWQLVSTHYLPHQALPEPPENKLVASLAYDLTTATVGQAITATVRATAKKSIGPGDMPMVEFLVPPGFDADLSQLDKRVANDMNVPRYEVKGSKVVIYLHNLSPDKDPGFEVKIPLQARFPMAVSAPGARAWIFFEPDHLSESAPVALQITP